MLGSGLSTEFIPDSALVTSFCKRNKKLHGGPICSASIQARQMGWSNLSFLLLLKSRPVKGLTIILRGMLLGQEENKIKFILLQAVKVEFCITFSCVCN